MMQAIKIGVSLGSAFNMRGQLFYTWGRVPSADYRGSLLAQEVRHFAKNVRQDLQSANLAIAAGWGFVVKVLISEARLDGRQKFHAAALFFGTGERSWFSRLRPEE
jgi:hypothetical protein